MNTKLFFSVLICNLIIGCSGPSLPPLKYTDNSRIALEGVLQNEDGNPLKNQLITLESKQYNSTVVNSTYSNEQGKFFISAPQSNYKYTLIFNEKKIQSVQQHQGLATFNKDDDPYYFGYLSNFSRNYYNFKIIKLTSI